MSKTIKLRTLMLAVLIFATVALLIRLWSQGKKVLTVRSANLSVKLHVIDAGTGGPVEDAWIRKFDLDFPENGLGAAVYTDRFGQAMIVETRLVNGAIDNQGRFDEWVPNPASGVRVGKDGYKPAEIPFIRDRIGAGGDPAQKGLAPPAIMVRLERSGP